MTRGQALMNRAKISRKSQDTLEAHQDEQATWVDKKSKYSGWGRFAGALALGGLALATGGTSLAIGAAAGLGSRLGSEAGENKADRGNIFGKKDGKGKGFKPKKLDKDLTLFRDEAAQINRDTAKFETDFDMKQNVDAAKDAYSAYNVSNVAQAYGGAATAEAATVGGEAVTKDAARVAAQSPKEGLMSMGRDWKAGAKKLFGGGAKDVAKDVTAEGFGRTADVQTMMDTGIVPDLKHLTSNIPSDPDSLLGTGAAGIEDSFVNSVAGKLGDYAETGAGRIATAFTKDQTANAAIDYTSASIEDILKQGANVDYAASFSKMSATHTFQEGIGWIEKGT
jgi:hypothetical protein